ncbi:cytidylyltransferase domain-containing protein [Solidesulfovibrio sp.]|uniref:acylneuraminate cytidylyltransferase family protein n=1 Tax=Solidesulfovibrio sp. TaxID=2910990 RepID=UPI002B2126AB|nr:NTP transferase domain-containing protein [Solidesulfovibrio sp.]MEA4855587.1 NTP transferase domain-containing protein [Solidesulfovibrio sp.]
MDKPSVLAMIPARMGSQRLKKKNLRELDGVPLLTRAIRKSLAAGCFDAVWINSEHPDFGAIAAAEGVHFHRRPEALASNTATSEDFVQEFLAAHPCDYLVQVHSIAPLLTAAQVAAFVAAMLQSGKDVFLSAVNEQIECAINGRPINFRYDRKTNSQELEPVQRITWSITGWRAASYLAAYAAGKCATYAGDVGYWPIDRAAGHIIKTEEDLRFAQAFLDAFPERGI